MSDARYHVRFVDTEADEELGLILTESPQIGFTRRLINPYAAKGATGDTQDSDLTEWSVLSFRDWRGGRGQEELVDKTRFFDSWNLESRIEGQLTLGPLPQNPVDADAPAYEPGSASSYGVYRLKMLAQEEGSGANAEITGTNAWAQRVYDTDSPSNKRILQVQVRVKRDAGVTTALRMGIYSDSGGNPNAELDYDTVAAANIGTTYDWEIFTFTDFDPSSYPVYWLVLSASGETGGSYYWSGGDGNPDVYGRAEEYDGSTWTEEAGWDMHYRIQFAPVFRSQSFVAPAGGITCTQVQVYCRGWNVGSGESFTVSLYSDSGGEPDSEITSKTVTGSELSGAFGWLEVIWDAGQALSGSTTYHIVVSPPTTDDGLRIYWGGASGYAGGASYLRINTGGSWTLQTPDMYFRVNQVGLDGDPIGFVRYSGDWYCAAGDTVYVWNETNSEWDVSDAVAGKDITSIEVWGGQIWVARGSANVVRVYDGAWANDGTNTAQLFKGGGGYLHRSDPTTVNLLYYTTDGSTWSDSISVGSSDYAITAMEWFRDMLVVATSVRLWGIAAEIAYPILEWHTQEDADNGKNMLYWSKTGALYIPLHYGLYRWNGDTMVAVGPEQGTGLPSGRDGKVAALVGTGNWLFAAVDGGASGKSSILVYGGMQGWHEIQRAEQDGDQILALGFETVHSPSRLWFGLGGGTRYLMLPDTSDNPYQWSGYEFNAAGELETSWIGGDLLEVVKDLHEVVIRGEDLSDDQTVDVWYEVDRSGQWTYLGQVTVGPRDELSFEASTFGTKTVGSSSTRLTIELASGSTTADLGVGDWVRINSEVVQVASITDSDTFVLETALESAPESGDVVYPSGPAGREFRFKLILATTDKTSTPKVNAVFVRYQNNVLDRFVFTLNVRVEDGLVDLAGNPYPHTAADLRVLLDSWAQRARSFTLYDPDGVARTVKVTSAAEGGYQRRQAQGQAGRYGTTYSMNLVEVA